MIERDLAIMSFFANIITLFPGMRWISLPEEVNVFGEMMYQQLDLRNEAENLLAFEHNFASRNVPVTFPRPLKVFSTSDILVEEFEHAAPLELFLKNGGGPFDEQVATIGLDAFLVCSEYWLAILLMSVIRTCYYWITLFILIFTQEIS